jgi:hypothetical protein
MRLFQQSARGKSSRVYISTQANDFMKIGKAKNVFRFIPSTQKKPPTSVWTLLAFMKRVKQVRLYGCMGNGQARGTRHTQFISAREKRKVDAPNIS